MKKIFLIFAILSIFVLQLGSVSAATKGDVNEDGIVTVKDETLIQMYIKNKITDSNKKLVEKNGDLNGDGVIDEKDETMIQKIILGTDSNNGSNEEDNENVDLDQEYSNLNTEVVSCGSGMISDVPISIPKAVNIVYTVLQIAVPITLVVFGMIDLVKAVIAGKEDEIKKSQMTFVKRLIVGALVFFVFVIIKLLVSFVADNSNTATKIMDCADCFLNGTENCDK